MGKLRKIQIINNKIFYYCNCCKEYLEENNFEIRKDTQKPRSSCKKCRKEESRLYHFMRRRKFSEEMIRIMEAAKR